MIGTEPINYADYFKRVGLQYGTNTINTEFFMHNDISYLSPNQDKNEVYFNTSGEYNSFLKSLDIQPKDVLLAINGQKFDLNNAAYIFELSKQWKTGDLVELSIRRNGEQFNTKTTITEKPTSLKKSLIEIPKEKLTPLQLTTKKTWLN